MIEPTSEISKRKDNIYVCRNVIDYKTILERGACDLVLDDNTVVYPSALALNKVLNEDCVKFLNVGRFSPEKGQMRLLDAFARVNKQNPNTKLIIMGGSSYKDFYNQIIDHVEKLGLHDQVVLVKSLSNPFPLVKQCDCSILSSFAEGFGLVIAEADVLDVSTFSVDIPGPKNFMEKYGGTLVDNSEDGIYRGMMSYIKGNIKPMHVDYAEYNIEAVHAFESMFSHK